MKGYLLFCISISTFSISFIARNSSMHVVSSMSHKMTLLICRSILALYNCFMIENFKIFFLLLLFAKVVHLFSFISKFSFVYIWSCLEEMMNIEVLVLNVHLTYFLTPVQTVVVFIFIRFFQWYYLSRGFVKGGISLKASCTAELMTLFN